MEVPEEVDRDPDLVALVHQRLRAIKVKHRHLLRFQVHSLALMVERVAKVTIRVEVVVRALPEVQTLAMVVQAEGMTF
jgi:hypothetical protein